MSNSTVPADAGQTSKSSLPVSVSVSSSRPTSLTPISQSTAASATSPAPPSTAPPSTPPPSSSPPTQALSSGAPPASSSPRTSASSAATSSAAPIASTAPSQTAVTSIVTTTPSETNAADPAVITLTSTSQERTVTTSFTPSPTAAHTPLPLASVASSASASASASTPESTPLGNSSAAAHASSGLSGGGKTAVAVVVPLVTVALIVLGLLFFFRRRKQQKHAEELRRKEAEDYNYNPNQDPSLPVVAGGAASSTGGESYEMRQDDGSGYRGWGAAPGPVRRPSTTLARVVTGPIGLAMSDNTSSSASAAPVGYAATAATTATSPTGSPGQPPSATDTTSGEPLLTQPYRPTTADSETIAELGAAPTASARRDLHRGPSNASSSYSAANRSEFPAEAAHAAGYFAASPGDAAPVDEAGYTAQQGPYAELAAASAYAAYHPGAAAVGQPVIRDNPARRNARIETAAATYPPPGNAGIAQNF
ncbi:MAG: hypothetical protein M1826_002803 [Phylliscum demangeonii]|nr:MAG: hypothetical protein M1826_002803 [Phylliscum demangeonii]